MRIHISPTIPRTAGFHSFGVVDNRGREIGARFEVTEVEIDGATCYAVTTQAMRGGKPFGSRNPSLAFASESDRALYLVQYLVSAKKRAKKTAGA